MRIDVHTHAFHRKIADKAVKQLVKRYKNDIPGIGTSDDLIKVMDEALIDKAFVHCAATSPEQVIPANTWAITLSENPRFLPFGTVHPDYPNWEEELDRLERKGLIGIKFHPDFQGYNLDDKKMFPIYEAIEKRFIAMFHVGDVFPPDENPSSPQKLAKVLRNFPSLTAIAAHLGGYEHWQWVKESLSGLNFYMDTSSSLKFIPDHLLREILSSFPEDSFLFGSDYPAGNPLEEIRLLEKKAGFSETQIDALLSRGEALINGI
ncbi:MAG: amidohydrolase family protein, partial [Spirochaetia bacterium]|nr:amidohydrolase family protein [Spirochaetia bacterium]